ERSFKDLGWTTIGRREGEDSKFVTSLHLKSERMEEVNIHLQKKYKEIEKNEVKFETIDCEDADYIFVAFGLVARLCTKAAQIARDKGLKVGVIRPITLFPFPKDVINEYASKVKGFMDVEMNAGQMIEDVKLAVNGKVPVEFYGRMGGIVPTPEEILEALEEKLIGGAK
ncbi:transketolase C-terminal domain-containing protein, partial [Bacteroidota bacterium]